MDVKRSRIQSLVRPKADELKKKKKKNRPERECHITPNSNLLNEQRGKLRRYSVEMSFFFFFFFEISENTIYFSGNVDDFVHSCRIGTPKQREL